MPDFSSDYLPDAERLRGVPEVLAWAAAIAFSCAFWTACAWAVWHAWRLAGGE